MNATHRAPEPLETGHNPSPDRDSIHFDRGGVRVTDSALTAHGRCYPIAELRHIRTMRGPYNDLTINASFLAVTIMIVIARLWDYLDTDGWVGALAVLGVAVGLVIVGSRVRRRLHIMVAEFRTLTVLLVLDDDRERYAQIWRAVCQARDGLGM
jgi:hypothetical protein